MSKHKLQLDKEKLVSLQQQQLAAVNGGADDDVEFTKPIDIENPGKPIEDIIDGLSVERAAKSCCKRSC
ncbi:MAG: class I lanthipeptide [Bacteroidota bacterium]